jgi:glutathione S-transferase
MELIVVKLYYFPNACSLAPHIVAREAGLNVDLALINFAAEPQLSEGRNYYEINPTGVVLALLLDDGSVLTEGAVILQCLAAKAPAPKLAPVHTDDSHWRFLGLLNFIATEVHLQVCGVDRRSNGCGYSDDQTGDGCESFCASPCGHYRCAHRDTSDAKDRHKSPVVPRIWQ